MIRNLYWQQKASVRLESGLTEWTDIKRGVRQGCVISPDIFNLYSEAILRQIEGMPGIRVGGININNIRYADDTVLIATSQKNLQMLVDKVKTASEEMGLHINKDKTKVMVVSKRVNSTKCTIRVDSDVIEQVDRFRYLGSIVTADGRSKNEVRRR